MWRDSINSLQPHPLCREASAARATLPTERRDHGTRHSNHEQRQNFCRHRASSARRVSLRLAGTRARGTQCPIHGPVRWTTRTYLEKLGVETLHRCPIPIGRSDDILPMHRQFRRKLGAAASECCADRLPSRFAGAVRAFHLTPSPFGHRAVWIDARAGLRVDDAETRTPLEIAEERRAELGVVCEEWRHMLRVFDTHLGKDSAPASLLADSFIEAFIVASAARALCSHVVKGPIPANPRTRKNRSDPNKTTSTCTPRSC